MPTSFLKKTADKHHISIQSAEKKWAEATLKAEAQGQKDNYAYITKIFTSMLGETASLVTDEPKSVEQNIVLLNSLFSFFARRANVRSAMGADCISLYVDRSSTFDPKLFIDNSLDLCISLAHNGKFCIKGSAYGRNIDCENIPQLVIDTKAHIARSVISRCSVLERLEEIVERIAGDQAIFQHEINKLESEGHYTNLTPIDPQTHILGRYVSETNLWSMWIFARLVNAHDYRIADLDYTFGFYDTIELCPFDFTNIGIRLVRDELIKCANNIFAETTELFGVIR